MNMSEQNEANKYIGTYIDPLQQGYYQNEKKLPWPQNWTGTGGSMACQLKKTMESTIAGLNLMLRKIWQSEQASSIAERQTDAVKCELL